MSRQDVLEQLVREELADHESMKHEHRMIMFGIGTILLGFVSSTIARRRRAAILRGDLYNDKVQGMVAKRLDGGRS